MTHLEQRNTVFRDWTEALDQLYSIHKEEKRFEAVKSEDIQQAKHLIWKETYHLKPVSCVFLEVAEDGMMYRGVPVTVLEDAPAGVKYQCIYMDPLNDLVLRSLGMILLERFFSQSWTLAGWKSFSTEIASAYPAGVTELKVLEYERTLNETEPSVFFSFFEEQLQRVEKQLNEYIRKMVLSYINLPYVNCLHTPENRLPEFRESDYLSSETLPFGMYLMGGVSRIAYIYDFLLTILVAVKSNTIVEDLPIDFQQQLYLFGGKAFLFLSDQVDPLFGIQPDRKTEPLKLYLSRAQQAGLKIDTLSLRPGDGQRVRTPFGDMEVGVNGKILTRCRH